MSKAKSQKSKRQANASSKSKTDLHGNAPDQSRSVLLLIDLINDLSFPNNEHLVRNSEKLARAIVRLKERCQRAGIPAIYVNDNHGKWKSNFSAVLQHCLRPEAPGRAMVKLLAPATEDYVILKPKHSAFYGTPLATILEYIGARTAILAGLTTNACVLIAAGELYVRDFRVLVPSDCVAALTDGDQRQALDLMRHNFGAEITSSPKLRLSRSLK